MRTIRLTMAQALTRYLVGQMTEIEGEKVPLIAGVREGARAQRQSRNGRWGERETSRRVLARPSPLTQNLPHKYAIVVSSERQAGVAAVGAVTNGACSGRRGLSGLIADCGTPGAYIVDATEDR